MAGGLSDSFQLAGSVALMPLHAASWLGLERAHPFGLAALPYCSFSTREHAAWRRAGVRVGDQILDLTTATQRLMAGRAELFDGGVLDPFLAAGDGAWADVRAEIQHWLSHEPCREAIGDLLTPVRDARLHLPFTVADFADFYASREHASRVGAIFRPGGDPLPPNWGHLPAGYHGRAGSVVVSGTRCGGRAGCWRPATGWRCTGRASGWTLRRRSGSLAGPAR